MSIFNNPISFDRIVSNDKYVVKYFNLREVCQGGPEIGRISINEDIVNDIFFGGPCLIDKHYLFIPMYVNKFLFSGFRIVRIDMGTMIIEKYGKIDNLIHIKEYKNNTLYYWKDIDQNNIGELYIPSPHGYAE